MAYREFLDSLINNEKAGSFSEYSPDNLRKILEVAGNPHLGIKYLHIAGTNGKGSTAHYLHGILTSLGFRTGLYTSPHLRVINERIRVNNDLISDSELDRHSACLAGTLELNPELIPTWFDALTFAAFRHFRESAVDFAVIETGLGGRLDSTSVITPEVSVITSVSLDHTHILGSTITEIAREKAGIIKPGVPALTACRGEALNVLDRHANAVSSPLFALERDLFARNLLRLPGGGFRYDLTFPAYRESGREGLEIPGVEIAQLPSVQVNNSALALAAAALISPERTAHSPGALLYGLRHAALPGRYEVLADHPCVIFDPAHNPAAMEELVSCLKDTNPGKSFTAVVTFMQDKDSREMLRIIQNRLTNRLFYASLNESRSGRPDLEMLKGFDAVITQNSDELAGALMKTREDDIILFTGSFRLYETALAVAARLKDGRH